MAPGVTLVLPPLTQLNTPYPSISYLARFLRSQGVATRQRDLGIELALRVYCREGLAALFDEVASRGPGSAEADHALALRAQHESVIGPVVAFLQGRDSTLARRLVDTPFLPRGPRLLDPELGELGAAAIDDVARHLATLYLADLADLVASEIDEGFALHRYQHHLAAGPVSFDAIDARLGRTTLLDQWLDELADTLDSADLVGLSVPFPGNLYGALRVGRRLRARGAFVVMGGGYVNTELREVDDARLWDNVDALTYDDGEAPLHSLIRWQSGGARALCRTRTREGYFHTATHAPTTFAADYGDLRLDHYLQLVDTTNPAHRMWGDGRWNKITLAHGCYWKKCSFCDVNLDYIARYAPARTVDLVDAVEALVSTTGQRGFHAVDEAAPPRGARDFALELLRRRLAITWWGNIRFESAFTPDLCRLLASSGLVAVTGGLEVASDRLLEKMQKGVTIEQVARAAAAFSQAGTLVHAYLMYGFPGQTLQETVDSAEVARQLFAAGVLRSAFWHRFVLTRHSAVYAAPAHFGVVPRPVPGAFAQNDVPHEDPAGAPADAFDDVLPEMLRYWMKGEQLDRPVHTWFRGATPATTEEPDRVTRALEGLEQPLHGRLLWVGGAVAALAHGIDGEEPVPPAVATLLQHCGVEHPPLHWDDVRPSLSRSELRALERVRPLGLLGIG